jgi:hypothetical protein
MKYPHARTPGRFIEDTQEASPRQMFAASERQLRKNETELVPVPSHWHIRCKQGPQFSRGTARPPEGAARQALAFSQVDESAASRPPAALSS